MNDTLQWIAQVEQELNKDTYKEIKKQGAESRKWYKGEEFIDDKTIWEGDLVRGNLWQRDYDILRTSIFSRLPNCSIRSKLNDTSKQKFVDSLSALMLELFKETHIEEELDRCFRRGLHENTGWVELDYDAFRKIPTLKWVAEEVVVDGKCNGILRRARWIAKIINRTYTEVMIDKNIPDDKKQKLLENRGKRKRVQNDMEETLKFYYIYSKFGERPWEKISGRKLIVIAEDLIDEPIMVEDWAWPFLDADEFPLFAFTVKVTDDSFYGVTIFKLLRPLFSHFNWANSFNLADARKSSTRKVLVRDTVENKEKLVSGNHLEMIPVTGDPAQAVHVVDFGSGSDSAYRTAQLAKQLHDEQSGITDMVRGQSPGDRTTAEEARLLNQNGAITFQEVADRWDRFLNEVMLAYAQSLLYYVPQWTRLVDPNGVPSVRIYQIVPLPTGQMDTLPSYVPIHPTELDQLGETDLPPGSVLRDGVDNWIGLDHAFNWQELILDEIKREFGLSVEAGSTNSQHLIEQQRDALTLFQTLGPIYQQAGFLEQYYELIKRLVYSFNMTDKQRLLPPLEKFTQATFIPEPVGKNKPGEQPPEQTMGMKIGQEMGVPSGQMGNPAELNTTLAAVNPNPGVS